MKRYLKAILVGVAMLVALALTVSKRGPAMMVGLGRSTGATSSERKTYDAANALETFNRTLGRIQDAYVDPTRIDPKQMLLSALDSVQKQVAEVMVEPYPEQNRVVVRVDTATREFKLNDVDSPWSLAPKMAEIFQFVTQHLFPGTDAETLRNIEYAAINGMLSTLDPHSILLDPTTYNDMKMSTRGSFGGLGIVIGLRKGALTVIRPMRGTPAWEAGVRRGDRITRIEKEPTSNIALNDAVNRLRGDPGTKVELWTERDGEKAPKRLVLTRAEISVNSVTSQLLKSQAGPIGYIKLSQFSQKCDEDMRSALEELSRKGQLRGLVLDLRHDPGGLLDKAIRVADEFLESGTIVTTVSFANKQREEKRATPTAQPRIPIAVLVDGQSASASEIVAGALKNLDRAVIIGSRTFGKGSVQVLYDNDDGSALKLTIAQYLTPGDVSIQSVGIMPDIVLEPMAVEKDRLALFTTYKGTREQDLDAHLTSQNAKGNDRPAETLRYIWTDPRKKAPAKPKGSLLTDTDKRGGDDEEEEEPADDLLPDDDDTFVEDFDIQYARDLLASVHGWKRHEVIASAKDFFSRKQGEEVARLTEALRKLGVDWTPVGPQQAPAKLVAKITSDKPGNEAKAGETMRLTATVTNQGAGVAGQVRAQLKSDFFLFDEREFIFGRIAPGETRTWTLPVKVPKDTLPRQDVVKATFSEEHNQAPAAQEFQVKLGGVARPKFAYSYQLIDEGQQANGDGQLQTGESARLRVLVKNVGAGKAIKPVAYLSSSSGDMVTVNKGRYELAVMAPGEEKAMDFTFDLNPDFKETTARVSLQIYDIALHDGVNDKLSFNILEGGTPAQPGGGSFTTSADADVRSGATASAPVIGKAKRGARFPVTGAFPGAGFVRVEVEPGRPGFIATSAGARGGDTVAAAPSQVALVWQVTPPELEVQNAALAVESKSIRLTAAARDKSQVLDAYVVVSNRTAKIEHRKVFYLSNRDRKPQNEMRFDATVPLWPGVNYVSVVARQSAQVQSSQTLIINRLGGPEAGKDVAAR